MKLLQRTNGSLAHQYAYRYDPAGNRTSEQMDATVNQASHNNLNQLLSRSGGGQMAFEGDLSEPGSVTLSGSAAQVDANNHFKGTTTVTTGTNSIPLVATDVNGNVTSKTIQVTVSGSANQSFSYDLDGNMTVDGSAGGNTYEWDAANRLTAINYAGTSKRTEFLYDGMSRRVRITEKNNGSVTSTKNLVWSGMAIAEERDANNTVTKRFFVQGCLNGTDKQYYARDHLGSVRDITNDAHAIEGSFDYDPWGRISLVNGTASYPDFGFTGHYYHSPSGLHLALYRGYSAETGRWVSRDLMGESEGVNLYSYVFDAPTRWVDALGLSNSFFHRGRCCNNTKGDEWALISEGENGLAHWKKLGTGECVGGWFSNIDCEGMTCGGGFYVVSGSDIGACSTPGCDRWPYNHRRWTPNSSDGDPGAGGPQSRGNPNVPQTPPDYHYGPRPI